MTVTYTGEVATCRGLGCFLKLLKRWKGSIYKLVWLDLVCFLSFYYMLSLTYRFILNEHSRRVFESIVSYCNEYIDLIPLSFVLGFYVSIVMTRWWGQYTAIPFPDPIAVFVSATVHGQDERGRVMRRTIMRYVCLCVTMMFTMISPRVKKRFPTLDHFIEAGLLHQSEKDIIASLNQQFPKYSKHWLPIVWAASIITRARKEGRIRDDFAVKTMLDELNKFRGQCALLLSYDTISIPLVYTQVVTLAVYTYFLTTLMGHQWVQHEKHKIDLYFPVFTTLQFFFYMGWLKVAESLINPFGDDDDDFEVNWMIDRNLQVSYLIVDEMHHEHPELLKDRYWDQLPQELPYTLASEPFRGQHPLPSTANIAVKASQAETFAPSSVKIDKIDNMQSDDLFGGINFTAKPSASYLQRDGSVKSSAMGTSVPDAINRVNSVAGRLKRLFSKEEPPSESRPGSALEMFESNSTLAHKPQLGSIKLTDQVIEEGDEQLTITSQRGNDVKPSVMDIFRPPPPSEPVPVPSVRNTPFDFASVYSRPLAQSAPEASPQIPNSPDNISIGLSDDDSDGVDEFARLRNLREKERKARVVETIAKSLRNSRKISDPMESELLLLEAQRLSTQSVCSKKDK